MLRALLLLMLGWGIAVPRSEAQDKPVPAAQAAAKFTLPKGFSATLFAGEPDLVQPIAFTFDDRGRLWVVECLSYPKWKQDGTGKDRVTLFEDTDGDGKFDQKQVVIADGSNLSGIELGYGGIWLCSVPNLVFVPCDFNADRPQAGKKEIVLDGWNIKDTKHNIFNSLNWGPDGWMYGCNGIQSKSLVGAPGTPRDKRVEINCGVWRYHPTRKLFQAVAHGTTNPFGMDFNEQGDIFITNCVIKHLFHFIPGGHYDRMYGQDINPYSFQLMPSIADYIHWAGGDWTSSRGNKPEHSDAGGGHAHSGCTIYYGDNFPEEYRGRLFTCNIHGNRLNTDKIVAHGSSYKSERAPDFLFANDPWFRGIAVKYGPDGGLYVSDWCDTGECHNYEVADTSNGRVFKVVYGKPRPWKTNLSQLSYEELFKLHDHRNAWVVQHVRRLICERARDPQERARILETATTFKHELSRDGKLQFIQTLECIDLPLIKLMGIGGFPKKESFRDGFDRTLMRNLFVNLESADPEIRKKAMEILTDGSIVLDPIYIRREYASGMTRVPAEQRLPMAKILLQKLQPQDATDTYLPLLSWYAIEPLVGKDSLVTLNLLKSAPLPLLRELIARKSILLNPQSITEILQWARSGPDSSLRDVLAGIQAAFGDRREVAMPTGWSELSPSLIASTNLEVRDRAASLAVMFGDQKAIEFMKTVLQDRNKPAGERTVALRVLLKRQYPELGPILLKLLDDTAIRGDVIRALASFKESGTAQRLLQIYPQLNSSEKDDAVQTLAARSEWALLLLEAIEKQAVPRQDVSAYVARQMAGLKDKQVASRLEKVWGTLQPASAKRAELTKKYKEILAPQQMNSAELKLGRQIYARQCASCHKLYDDGGDVGPALTGAQRHNLDYLLENILDPSANVPREYQVQTIITTNGRTISGIVKSESNNSLTLRTANDTVLIAKSEIEERQPSKMSIMPEGILDQLTSHEVRSLVAYLQGKEQVPK